MKPRSVRPIHQIPPEVCRNLAVFFMDIDDTFTTDGRITAAAFQSLWKLYDAGIGVVPVTGRPAGWCDMIARFWPVEAVIGENGAFCFSYDYQKKTMIRQFYQSDSDRIHGANLLKQLERRVLRDVPGCAISADQSFRIADLAIDFCEDVPALPDESIRKICSIARNLDLNCKVSSIHVNCWYGSHDKNESLEKYLFSKYSLPMASIQPQILFIGDSPNDEPLFAAVDNSVAVSNIHRFLDTMTHWPAYMTQKRSGDGFCELVNRILKHRS
jgi:HAD superfamily hydrolase (TIGR01484 family)